MRWFTYTRDVGGSNSNQSAIRLFGRMELWWSTDQRWLHPSEWVWHIERNQTCGCLMAELGWWGATVFRGDCKRQFGANRDD